MIIRLATLFLGLTLLVFGVAVLLVPRARFVNSTPAPGTALAEPPSAVTVSFSNKLAGESTLLVTWIIKVLPSGETEYLNGSSVVTSAGIDPTDASGRSMRANLRSDLHRGVYWVNWRTKAAGWRTIAYGETAFGVGMAVPDYLIADMGGTKFERDFGWRTGRATLIGGLILIALGLFSRKRFRV